MSGLVQAMYKCLKGTPLHPQWLTDRLHTQSRQILAEIDNDVVLDIGSGNTDNSDSLGANNFLIRLDYPDTNLRYDKKPEVYGDACYLPIATHSIDTVLILEVLEHIADHRAAVAETHRVLKHNGKLILSVPFIYPIHDAPHDFCRFTEHGLRHLLEQNNYQIEQIRKHGNSFTVSIQLFNLALLEFAQKQLNRSSVLGLIVAGLAYPICIANNILGFLLSHINTHSSLFGYFIIARCNKEAE